MLRLTFLLCCGLFLVMLLGGRDFGQLRPGLALAAAGVQAVPVTAAVPVVETVALASDAVAAPVVVPKPAVVAAPVVVADAAPVTAAPITAAPVTAAPVTAAPVQDNAVFTLSNYAEPAAELAAPEQAVTGEIWYVAGNSLNVRAGPSTDDAVVGKLSRGEAMLVVAREGDEWAQIRIEGDGIEGYVATRFLSAEVPVLN